MRGHSDSRAEAEWRDALAPAKRAVAEGRAYEEELRHRQRFPDLASAAAPDEKLSPLGCSTNFTPAKPSAQLLGGGLQV